MLTFDRIAELREQLEPARVHCQRIGFVPTMGALHDGHIALVRKARSECDYVVVSIFVNPAQFGPNEDFSAYPRDVRRDLDLIEDVGADVVFLPVVDEIYQTGFQTFVEVAELTRRLEGAIRPTHFRGVTTVVSKLFNIVQPDAAYFGQKDYQQLLVIERMVRDLCLPVEIVPVATVREIDGLAMSSRNGYLDADERRSATALYRSLRLASERIADGATDARTLARELSTWLEAEPLLTVQYVEIVDPETLNPLARLNALPVLLVLAVKIGRTRLIDNALIGTGGIWQVRDRLRPT